MTIAQLVLYFGHVVAANLCKLRSTTDAAGPGLHHARVRPFIALPISPP